MTPDTIITIASTVTICAGSIIAQYVFLKSALVEHRTEIKHLKDEQIREREDRLKQFEKVEQFHHQQVKAWHEMAVAMEGLKGVISSFKQVV
jgi:uncharacterized protein (DUF3084 family)